MNIKVTKSLVDDLFETDINYWETGNTDYLDKRLKISKQLNEESEIDWLVWCEITDVCVKQKCPRLSLYIILAILGVEVVDR